MGYMDLLNDPSEVKDIGSSISKIPEGKYLAKITNIDIKEDLFPQRHRYSIEFTISDGEFASKKAWMNTTISDDTKPEHLANFKAVVCKMAGVKSTAGDINSTLNTCYGGNFEISIKYSENIKNPEKPWTRVYIVKKLD